MSLLPADWYEDAFLKEDMTVILGVLAQQNGGRIHIPFGEILAAEQEAPRPSKLSVAHDRDGGYTIEVQKLDEGEVLLPNVTYMNKGVEYFGPENEATDQA